MALFGAIVAVGLGPALWLGAQFGRFDVDTSRPPAPVSEQHSSTDQLLGGSGAGDTSTGDDNATVLDTTPRANIQPLTPSPSASPSASSSSSARPDGSASPSTSASSDPEQSRYPSASPSESTDPDDPPGDGGGTSGDPTVPPSPPASGGGDGSGDGSGSGDGGSGGGSGSGGGGVSTDPAYAGEGQPVEG
jgi:uncharacterized membrane protein YgcG